MRLTVKGQRADTEVNGSLLPTYGMQTREKALEKNREEKDSNLYPDAISANVLWIRRDRESDGMERCKASSGANSAPGTVVRYETCLRPAREFMRNTYNRYPLNP